MSAPASTTHVALLTPAGRGAIASLAVEGSRAVAIVASFFQPANRRAVDRQPDDRILYGKWGPTGEEVVVARRSASRVEIHCHGGLAASQSILDSLVEAGCCAMSWQAFVTQNEASPLRAAARIALANAPTERTARILLDQYHGALEEALTGAIGLLETGHLAAAARRLQALLLWSDVGQHLTKPWRVAIGGPPNAGKSTLLNALVGFERAIVFDEPGTTRDVVSVSTAIDGWAIELADTAGLRESEEPIEREGVTRASAEFDAADLTVLVFDVSQPWTPEIERMAQERPTALIVHNKADLLGSTAVERTEVAGPSCFDGGARRPPGMLLSAKTGWRASDLLARISSRLVPEAPPSGVGVPFDSGQLESIRTAIGHVELGSVDAATTALARLVCQPPPV